jgi:molybdate/tungstate transport system substrate-binding protein
MTYQRIHPGRGVHTPALLLAILVAIGGCGGGKDTGADNSAATSAPGDALLVYNAASVTRPVRAVLDSFTAHTGVRTEQETASSLELARKVTELGAEPDVLLLADPDIFPKLLEPTFTTWYAIFARNRIVLGYTPKSKGASEIDSTNWFKILERPGVEVGRSDPQKDPSGYRTLLVWQLAANHYKQPGLYNRMLEAAPPKNVRAREAEQVALLQTGELDYIWTYQNLADNAGLKYVKLPGDVDLGSPADSNVYAQVSTRVLGKRAGDTVIFRGVPILFGAAIPVNAPHAKVAERFVAFLLSAEGARILRGHHLDALDHPVLIGNGIPKPVTDSLRVAPVVQLP